MSTFNGIVREFPQIRIDYFRVHPDTPPPLACFLSHVHSDHLQGLESLRSPFVYCSAATKRLLLRMEKYPHRMNFAKGILEARRQHYRHLKLVLKALPLETPTELELSPKAKIQVTLFDANHCSGSVMFLIEGDDQVVLYTGDIRSEPWWVNNIIRNPVLVPYTIGERRLDCIYLDTTFANHEDVYRNFQTKAEGLAELIRKTQAYPINTRFYFRAWTLGYEGVWIALSRALKARVHVDEYQMRLFGSLVDENREGISIADGPALVGFQAGNHFQPGCLTNEASVKLHSCEPGTACHAEMARDRDIVWITPIVSRTEDGTEVRELGAGGGGGDLYQIPELDGTDDTAIQAFAQLCTNLIQDPVLLSKTTSALFSTKRGRNARLSLEGLGIDLDQEISLAEFVEMISRKGGDVPPANAILHDPPSLKNTIHFPYSRHSSYNELRHLVSAFQPKDICPCTVDEYLWSEEISMQSLFGDVCSEQRWYHDQQTRIAVEERKEHLSVMRKRKREYDDDGETQWSSPSEDVFETAPAQATVGDRIIQSKDFTEAVQVNWSNAQSAQCWPGQASAGPSNSCERYSDAIVAEQDILAGPSNSKGEAVGSQSKWLLATSGISEALSVDLKSQGKNGKDGEDSDQEQQRHLEAIKRAFHAINTGHDTAIGAGGETEFFAGLDGESEEEHNAAIKQAAENVSQISLASTAFESQPRAGSTLPLHGYAAEENTGLQLQLDGSQESPVRARNSVQARHRARKEAYRAAQLCLKHSDCGEWDELGSSAMGEGCILTKRLSCSAACVRIKGQLEEVLGMSDCLC